MADSQIAEVGASVVVADLFPGAGGAQVADVVVHTVVSDLFDANGAGQISQLRTHAVMTVDAAFYGLGGNKILSTPLLGMF